MRKISLFLLLTELLARERKRTEEFFFVPFFGPSPPNLPSICQVISRLFSFYFILFHSTAIAPASVFFLLFH